MLVWFLPEKLALQCHLYDLSPPPLSPQIHQKSKILEYWFADRLLSYLTSLWLSMLTKYFRGPRDLLNGSRSWAAAKKLCLYTLLF